MRKKVLLKLLLPFGLMLLVCSFWIGHFVPISESFNSFLKGIGITFIVAYFLKASVTRTA